MAIEQKALAERWELSKGRISQLVSEGMPIDSIEAAEKWRAERIGDPFPASPEVRQLEQKSQSQNLETFESIIERQRMLVQISRNQYIKAVREGSNQQSKLYASYDKTISTLAKLNEEADRISVFKREHVNTLEAREAMLRLAGLIVERLDALGSECGENCNPKDPIKSIGVLTEWAREAREKVARVAGVFEEPKP
tara:strand:- start:69 stop:656 length:588 start_codon:yes stop_codon:yes gene_type:complete